jgi:probable rRNA maturation factor
MRVTLGVRNESARKRVVRRDRLARLAERICEGESLTGDIEISVLFCDDPAIAELNRRFGENSGATDVLSFEQPAQDGDGRRVLGDIVISLETAERNCAGDRVSLRNEVELLFCHGVLHLLGYDHRTDRERTRMNRRQAEYLGVSERAAWDFGPKAVDRHCESAGAVRGGGRRVGR